LLGGGGGGGAASLGRPVGGVATCGRGTRAPRRCLPHGGLQVHLCFCRGARVDGARLRHSSGGGGRLNVCLRRTGTADVRARVAAHASVSGRVPSPPLPIHVSSQYAHLRDCPRSRMLTVGRLFHPERECRKSLRLRHVPPHFFAVRKTLLCRRFMKSPGARFPYTQPAQSRASRRDASDGVKQGHGNDRFQHFGQFP